MAEEAEINLVKRTFWHRQLDILAHPSAMLLLAQIMEITFYPRMTSGTERTLLAALSMVTLVLIMRLIHHTRRRAIMAAIFGAAAILIRITLEYSGLHGLAILGALVEAILYFYAGACFAEYVLSDRRATTDELFAASATFMLLIWAFTHLLALCQLVQPAAFVGNDSTISLPNWSELTFLSFALFTNTGIGTVVPHSTLSRTIGSLEMFAGVMYVAFVVSRLIAITTRSKE